MFRRRRERQRNGRRRPLKRGRKVRRKRTLGKKELMPDAWFDKKIAGWINEHLSAFEYMRQRGKAFGISAFAHWPRNSLCQHDSCMQYSSPPSILHVKKNIKIHFSQLKQVRTLGYSATSCSVFKTFLFDPYRPEQRRKVASPMCCHYISANETSIDFFCFPPFFMSPNVGGRRCRRIGGGGGNKDRFI